jgi:hypothetical protein
VYFFYLQQVIKARKARKSKSGVFLMQPVALLTPPGAAVRVNNRLLQQIPFIGFEAQANCHWQSQEFQNECRTCQELL